MLAVLFPANNTELTNFVIFFSNNSCDLCRDLTALGQIYLYQMILLSYSYVLGYEGALIAWETNKNSFLIVKHHHMFKNIGSNLIQGQASLKLRTPSHIAAIYFVITTLNSICNHYCHGSADDKYFLLKYGCCLDNHLMPKIRQ